MKEKVLVTGANGFTGRYIIEELRKRNYIPHILNANILHYHQLIEELDKVRPNKIIHLAGVSFTQHEDLEKMYLSNLNGTINILEAVKNLKLKIESMLITSTGSAYKNNLNSKINENSLIKPTNHYAVSKLAMEFAANLYRKNIPLLILRPFNYTGVGQDPVNLVPKIVKAFKEKNKNISLGNIDIYREFNDVRSIAIFYVELIKKIKNYPTPINVCSGNAVSISNIIELCSKITGHDIYINKDERFIRENDPRKIVGDPKILKKLIPNVKFYKIEETLSWMLLN